MEGSVKNGTFRIVKKEDLPLSKIFFGAIFIDCIKIQEMKSGKTHD